MREQGAAVTTATTTWRTCPRMRRRRCSRRGPTSSSRPPAHADQLELAVTNFFAALSGGLADAGCTLVGHIKGTLTVPDHGDLAFHATALAAKPALTGGVAGVTGRRRPHRQRHRLRRGRTGAVGNRDERLVESQRRRDRLAALAPRAAPPTLSGTIAGHMCRHFDRPEDERCR